MDRVEMEERSKEMEERSKAKEEMIKAKIKAKEERIKEMIKAKEERIKEMEMMEEEERIKEMIKAKEERIKEMEMMEEESIHEIERMEMERIKEFQMMVMEERIKEMGIEEMEMSIKEMEMIEKEERSKGPIMGERLVSFIDLMGRMMMMKSEITKKKSRMMKKMKLKIETSGGEGEPEKKKRRVEEFRKIEEFSKNQRMLFCINYKNLRCRESTEPVKKELKAYWEQVISSGGFDVDRCPPYNQCVIRRVLLDHDDHDGDGARKFKVKLYHRLCHLSALALTKYNADNATHFIFSKYLKANQAPCAGTKYYITFEAKQDSVDDPPVTFQAFVYYGIPIQEGTELIEDVDVKLVRLKSAASEKDNPILLSYID